MTAYRALLRNRNFLAIWIGGTISNIGDFFNSVALMKILADRPNQLGLMMALVMLAQVLPTVLLSLLAGVVADRLPRRMLMISADLIRGVLVLGLVMTNRPALIILLVVLASTVSTFHNPAANALLPTVVGPEDLVMASSLVMTTQRLAQLVGMSLGAVALIALGAHNVFFLDAASFVLSALCVGAIALPAAVATLSPRTERVGHFDTLRRDLREAYHFLRHSRPMRHLTISTALSATGDSATNVLLVPFFTITLGIASDRIGFVFAVYGGATMIGALVLGVLGRKLHWRHLLSFGAAYVWLMTLGSILGGNAAAGVFFFALVGFGSGSLGIGFTAASGTLVPDHLRGRVISAWNMVRSGIFTVGCLVAGLLSDRFGPAPVLLVFTLAYLLKSLHAFWAFGSLTAERTQPIAAGN